MYTVKSNQLSIKIHVCLGQQNWYFSNETWTEIMLLVHEFLIL